MRGSTVGLDTSPLIYYIEEHPAFLPKIKPFFEAAARGEFRVVTSFITLIEVLVHPLREGRPEFAEEYRAILLQSAEITAISLDAGIAEEAQTSAQCTTSERLTRFSLQQPYTAEHPHS